MGAQAGERSEQDGGDRGAECQMQHFIGGKTLRGKDDGQQRDDHDTTADTEQAGEKTGDGAGQQIGRNDIKGNQDDGAGSNISNY